MEADSARLNARTDNPRRPSRRTRPSGLRRVVQGWLTFAGIVLAIAVMRIAQPVLVPVALALLLTFVLNGPVTFLQRWLRRSIATGLVVTVFVGAVGLLGWVLAAQVTSLAEDLPAYRQNIRGKVADIRGAGEQPWMERLQSTVDDIQTELRKGKPRNQAKPTPVVVADEGADSWGLPRWTAGLVGPAGTLAAVFALVTFMLLEYGSLRDRVLAVIGHGYLANATQAFDEAASRLSRYLTMQLLINMTYGSLVALGLWWIGVPYPLLWGTIGGIVRFVPYVGPWIGAGLPIAMSVAVFPGWEKTLATIGLVITLELFTNLVLETLLYAGAVGVSQVALLVAVGFWTWLWGGVGLLLAMPLTVCVVVMSRHVPGLESFRIVMSDTPALSPDQSFYQRALADRHVEARQILKDYLHDRPAAGLYDEVLLPALQYARRDRRDRRISRETEARVATLAVTLAKEIAMPALAESLAEQARDGAHDQTTTATASITGRRLRVLGYPANGPSGAAALTLLGQLCQGLPIEIDVVAPGTRPSEMVERAQNASYDAVCIADLPPPAKAKVRRVLAGLAAARPNVPVLVGRWTQYGVAATGQHQVDYGDIARDAGETLAATRDLLRELREHEPAQARPMPAYQATVLQPVAPVDLH